MGEGCPSVKGVHHVPSRIRIARSDIAVCVCLCGRVCVSVCVSVCGSLRRQRVQCLVQGAAPSPQGPRSAARAGARPEVCTVGHAGLEAGEPWSRPSPCSRTRPPAAPAPCALRVAHARSRTAPGRRPSPGAAARQSRRPLAPPSPSLPSALDGHRWHQTEVPTSPEHPMVILL